VGIVTEKLIAILREQIDQRGTVVWFDPARDYAGVAAALTIDQVGAETILRYDPGVGFFDLRHTLESIWQSIELNAAPKLLIYVPLAQTETHHALIEYQVGGGVMQPDQQPPECNTALAAVTRLALEAIFPTARLEEIAADVVARKLSLDELDQLAERGSEAQTGALAVIFGTGNVTEVVLAFLSSADLDTRLAEKRAEPDMAKLLSETLGIDLNSLQAGKDLRARAARQILVTDFIHSLEGAAADMPASLKTFPLAQQPVARQAAIDLAQQWRNRRDIAPSYVDWAKRIQAELGIGTLSLSLEALARTETFPTAELRLQSLVEEALIKRATITLIDLVRERINGFWSSQQPETKTRWEVILNAGRVLQEAARIESGLKGKQWSGSKLFAQYVYGETPWCSLDTVQRHLERDIHRYELNLQNQDSLQRLIALASQQYATILNRLAELFVGAYRDEQFELPDVQLQVDIYRDFVAPRARTTRVAYILVDAFRFEMAREFHAIVEAMEPTWQSELTPALATPPTITDIGMAALMPGAEDGLLLKAERETLIPFIGGKAIRNAKGRFERLQVALADDVLVLTLDDIAPLRKPKISKDLQKARFAVVTASDDIDGLGENMPQKARRSIDEVLNLLRRGLSALFNAGFREVVITADHGFILADRLEDSQKIDAPEGQQVLLKRRVWIGRGGALHDAVMQVPLSAFGIGGDLELATPLGLAVFKVQGGNAEYFHGGLALQEIVIPVLVISATSSPTQATPSPLRWTLTLGSHKITSPYVSVTVEASSNALFQVDLPSVRVEIRDRQQTLSVPVSASYGFQEATKDVKLALGKTAQEIEKNTIMVFLSEKTDSHTVDVHLLDANTGLSLHRLENVESALSLFN